MFTHALMTWGDKMIDAEIDDIFGEFEIDEDYMIKTKDVVGLFVAVKEEEEEGRQVNGYFSISMKPRTTLGSPARAVQSYIFLRESQSFLRLTSARLSLHS